MLCYNKENNRQAKNGGTDEEVGVRESLTRKLVRGRLKWVGPVDRMGGEQLTKRADALRVEGGRRRGRRILRWEDCVKRDLAGVGVENESEG